MTARFLPFLVSAAGLASACGYSQEAGDKLANEVYALQTQLQALSKQMNAAERKLEHQNDQISNVNEQIEQLNKAARRNDADLGVQVDELMQQVARLRGEFESANERVETSEQEISRLKEQGKISAANSEEDKQKAIEAARAKERLLGSPDALMEEVTKLLNAQKFDDARVLLREFMLRAKDDKRLDKWSDQAAWLTGESYFIEGDYKRAATEFNALRKKHPKSSKVPDALYRMGECFEKLSLPDDAKLFYETLRKQFPKSKAADKAKDRLQALKDPQPG